MADTARLQELERRLALAANQQLGDLRAQVEAAGREQVRAAVEAYRAKLVELLGGAAAARARLAQVAAEPIREIGLGFLADAARPFVEQALEARRELEAALRVGPVTLDLGAVAASVAGGRVVGLLPIDSLHLDFNAGALRASGSGFLRENEAGGLLSGNLGVAKVTVAGLIAQHDGLLGVLALLRAEFRPTGIQLGLGFSLDSIGGIVGVHRTADVDELRRRLVDGSATEALFGGSTTASGVRATLETLAAVFPVARDRVVVGPTFRLGWLNVGGTSLVHLDLGVILTLPDARVLLPGRAVLEVAGPGTPLVHLRADMLGVVDVPGKRLTIDAALVDSQVLGSFRIGGTAAAYLTWGDQPVAVLTVGGFFPGFDPAPAQIAPQQRISLSLTSPLPGLRLSAEGYAAAAAGTLQFGGSITAGYDIGIAAIRGSVYGDAIIQLSPLYAEVRVGGGVAIEALGVDLLEVNCHGTLTGPGPLTLTLTATAKILWEEVGGTARFTLSSEGGADLAPADLIADVVKRELNRSSNAMPEEGGDPQVVPRRPASPPALPLVPARGGVVWRQDRFPLGVPVEKADGRKLAAPATVHLDPPAGGSMHEEPLATAMFLDLTTAEVLALGPYQRNHVGYRIPVVQTRSASAVTASSDFVELRLPTIPPVFMPLTAMLATSAVSRAMRSAAGGPALQATAAAAVTAVDESVWVVADDGGGFTDPGDGGLHASPASALMLTHADAARTSMPSAAFAEVAL